jgi:hypothetical protein
LVVHDITIKVKVVLRTINHKNLFMATPILVFWIKSTKDIKKVIKISRFTLHNIILLNTRIQYPVHFLLTE